MSIKASELGVLAAKTQVRILATTNNFYHTFQWVFIALIYDIVDVIWNSPRLYQGRFRVISVWRAIPYNIRNDWSKSKFNFGWLQKKNNLKYKWKKYSPRRGLERGYDDSGSWVLTITLLKLLMWGNCFWNMIYRLLNFHLQMTSYTKAKFKKKI